MTKLQKALLLEIQSKRKLHSQVQDMFDTFVNGLRPKIKELEKEVGNLEDDFWKLELKKSKKS